MLYHTYVYDTDGWVIATEDGRYGAMAMSDGTWMVRFPGARGTERVDGPWLADALIGLELDREIVK